MWKNTVERGRPQMTIWRMRIACLIPKATKTHTRYVILIAFHCNNGCTDVPQCYVIRASLLLFVMEAVLITGSIFLTNIQPAKMYLIPNPFTL